MKREENYLKQTYRNRCVIMGSNGPLPLVVPVLRGSFHKTAIKDLR
ncbi:MAG: WbqC family protein [Bacteroidales bacterium]